MRSNQSSPRKKHTHFRWVSSLAHKTKMVETSRLIEPKSTHSSRSHSGNETAKQGTRLLPDQDRVWRTDNHLSAFPPQTFKNRESKNKLKTHRECFLTKTIGNACDLHSSPQGNFEILNILLRADTTMPSKQKCTHFCWVSSLAHTIKTSGLIEPKSNTFFAIALCK